MIPRQRVNAVDARRARRDYARFQLRLPQAEEEPLRHPPADHRQLWGSVMWGDPERVFRPLPTTVAANSKQGNSFLRFLWCEAPRVDDLPTAPDLSSCEDPLDHLGVSAVITLSSWRSNR